jgi:hypothetical protein
MNPNGKVTEKSRYLKCRLYNNYGECEIVRHHRVAAMHYVPNPRPDLFDEVNHKDGDRDNNHISNFEWTNHRDNVLHGKITKGRSSQYTGVSFYNGKKSKNWVSKCYFNNKEYFLGGFDTEIEAANAYKEFVNKNDPSLNYVV